MSREAGVDVAAGVVAASEASEASSLGDVDELRAAAAAAAAALITSRRLVELPPPSLPRGSHGSASLVGQSAAMLAGERAACRLRGGANAGRAAAARREGRSCSACGPS